MSLRIRTSEDHEKVVRDIRAALVGDTDLPEPEKWIVLRLALAASHRLGVRTGERPQDLRPSGRGGPEYRLQQITGEGRGLKKLGSPDDDVEKLDITDATRAALSALHQVDLFHPETGASDLAALLEFHIARGLDEIVRLREERGDLWAALEELLAPPPEQRDMDKEAPTPRGLQDALWEVGLHVQIPAGPVHGPRLSRYVLRLSDPRDLNELRSRLEQLALGLGAPLGSLQLSQGEEPRAMVLDVPRPRDQWRSIGLTELEAARTSLPRDAALPICPGVDVMGAPRWLDLAVAPHLMVAGTTGSGKSVCVHAILASLLAARSPREVTVTLIDLKGTELRPWVEAPHRLGELTTEASAAREVLEAAVAEMERRYQSLARAGARDLSDGRARGLTFPASVIVVDELADLLLSLPEVETALVRLAQKGRAAGMHLLLATQRPDAKTFTGLLRSNVPARIALAVQRASESRIILDEVGAENLLRPGDMLVRWGAAQASRAHGFNLRPDDVEYVVRALSRAT